MLTSSALLVVALSAVGEAAQYGHNHVAVSQDSDLVGANFPEVDLKLLSPAFEEQESVPVGFAQGIEGPTDDATLGTRSQPCHAFSLGILNSIVRSLRS